MDVKMIDILVEKIPTLRANIQPRKTISFSNKQYKQQVAS